MDITFEDAQFYAVLVVSIVSLKYFVIFVFTVRYYCVLIFLDIPTGGNYWNVHR